ncbi:hypothetical protein CCOA0035 [Campylobacter coli RM2228]|nr:hypothetical protein CCOA0035 [Campylobacter coli RM2228]
MRFGGCNENIKNTLYLLDYIFYLCLDNITFNWA